MKTVIEIEGELTPGNNAVILEQIQNCLRYRESKWTWTVDGEVKGMGENLKPSGAVIGAQNAPAE